MVVYNKIFCWWNILNLRKDLMKCWEKKMFFIRVILSQLTASLKKFYHYPTYVMIFYVCLQCRHCTGRYSHWSNYSFILPRYTPREREKIAITHLSSLGTTPRKREKIPTPPLPGYESCLPSQPSAKTSTSVLNLNVAQFLL